MSTDFYYASECEDAPGDGRNVTAQKIDSLQGPVFYNIPSSSKRDVDARDFDLEKGDCSANTACYTHNNLGWKMNVVDPGESSEADVASSAVSRMREKMPYFGLGLIFIMTTLVVTLHIQGRHTTT